MADRTQLRIADRDENIAEDDPFAELTRIMGFDPRVPVKPEGEARSEAVTGDDFAIDLEKELMGEFGDEPQPASGTAYAPAEQPAYEPAPEAGYSAPEDAHFDAGPEFDRAAAESLADDLFLDESAFDEAPADSQVGQPVDFIADDQPDFADFDEVFAPDPVEARAETTAEPDFTGLDEALSAEFSEPEQARDDFPAFDDADFAFEEPQVQEREQPVAAAFDDAGLEDNGDEFERALAAAVFDESVGQVDEPVAETYAQQPVESVEPEPVAEAPQASLEDELSALLNRMSARPQPAYEPEFQLEKPLDVHVGHASAPVLAPEADEQPEASAPAYGEFDLDLDLAAFDDQPQGGDAHQHFSPETLADPVEALTPYAAGAAAVAASAQAHSWSRGTPFIRPQQQPSEPQAAPAAYQPQQVEQTFAAATPDYVVSPVEAAEPQYSAPVEPAPRQPAAEMPELETIEIPEKAVALADDLDIPDVPFEEDKVEAPVYDDLDAEFTSLMNEMNEPASAEPAPEAPRQQAAEHGATPVAASAADDADQFGDFDFNDFAAQPYAAQEAADDGFDYDPEAGEAMSDADGADEQRPRNRMLLVAAVVGAVALIGGIGAFALSFGGGDSGDAPVLVKADESPIKIKPENPGGAVIPNQDNKVYDMVARGGTPATPTQEKLVSDAEQPVDVAARAADARPDARIVGEGAPAKSEDRIEPAQADGDASTEEVPAVAPRKVRTMVVRPDGTLVPREDPQPAQQVAASEPTDPAPQSVSAPGSEQTGAVTPAINPQQTASTPSAAPVVPQRPAEQPVDVVGEVKPGQVAALDPNAAAAGTWAMQIASQPSAEAAQSTYQDLARRYASVLEGRSVNVVRAEVAGKGTFYRVRVAASSRAEAISLCEKYKAAGGNCFVSK